MPDDPLTTALPPPLPTHAQAPSTGLRAWALGGAAWAVCAALLWATDGPLNLANQALLLVLGGAMASLWLALWPSLLMGVVAVLAFNWGLIEPRGTFWVAGRQDGLLLGTVAVVNAVVALLVSRLRTQAQQARWHQHQAEQLRSLSETLRDSTEPLAHAGALQATLARLVGAPAALLVCRDRPELPTPETVLTLGDPDEDEATGLWHCLRQGQAMGPGTGQHGTLAQWYLPLRGRQATLGAALLRLPAAGWADEPLRAHAQALCDQFGLALQRAALGRAEQRALAQAQTQAVRNALLAAISHDYRTPLATILGAASSLQDQGDRLDATQRQRLAARIVAEVGHLSRLTDNTLQLARLDAPGMQLRLDWESAEELVGTALRRARATAPGRPLRARLEPGLPLLRCDAMLMTQLLDNLVENALKHTPDNSPIEILVRRDWVPAPRPGGEPVPAGMVLAVRDRGPGVAPAWRERIFDAFQRGDAPPSTAARRGAGVGLAVCRAIAQAHGGRLTLRARANGGCAFECHLPQGDPPPAALPDESAS